jgi:hypothetical protein
MASKNKKKDPKGKQTEKQDPPKGAQDTRGTSQHVAQHVDPDQFWSVRLLTGPNAEALLTRKAGKLRTMIKVRADDERLKLVQGHGEVRNKGMMDEVFFSTCGMGIAEERRDYYFREAVPSNDPALASRLEGDMTLGNGLCYDFMFYMFNEDALLSCFLCHQDHPFSAWQRRMLYLSVLAISFLLESYCIAQSAPFLLLSAMMLVLHAVLYQLGHCFCLSRYGGMVKQRVDAVGKILLCLAVGMCWGLFVSQVFEYQDLDREERFEYLHYFICAWGAWVGFGLAKETLTFTFMYLVQMCFAEPDEAVDQELQKLEEDDQNLDLSSAELFAKLHATQKKRRGKKSPAKGLKAGAEKSTKQSTKETAKTCTTKGTDKKRYLAPHEIPSAVDVGDTMFVLTTKGYVRCVIEGEGASLGSVNFGEDSGPKEKEEEHYMDDVIYAVFGICVPREKLEQGFRERALKYPDKLEKLLNGKVAFSENYMFDLFYFIFNKDHVLGILYADKQHPFSRIERLKVYFCMTCLAFLFASSFKAPDDCEAYVDSASCEIDPATGEAFHPVRCISYTDEHSVGRVDLYYTHICTLGYSVTLLNTIVSTTF